MQKKTLVNLKTQKYKLSKLKKRKEIKKKLEQRLEVLQSDLKCPSIHKNSKRQK